MPGAKLVGSGGKRARAEPERRKARALASYLSRKLLW
jgi:hypothetical protein